MFTVVLHNVQCQELREQAGDDRESCGFRKNKNMNVTFIVFFIHILVSFILYI